jgi:hypothetical protein
MQEITVVMETLDPWPRSFCDKASRREEGMPDSAAEDDQAGSVDLTVFPALIAN